MGCGQSNTANSSVGVSTPNSKTVALHSIVPTFDVAITDEQIGEDRRSDQPPPIYSHSNNTTVVQDSIPVQMESSSGAFLAPHGNTTGGGGGEEPRAMSLFSEGSWAPPSFGGSMSEEKHSGDQTFSPTTSARSRFPHLPSFGGGGDSEHQSAAIFDESISTSTSQRHYPLDDVTPPDVLVADVPSLKSRQELTFCTSQNSDIVPTASHDDASL